ncbi:hypothetical protein F5144DRAFT_43973 [Chaetomium tenue]|uniref:Uncharacterized protein n=1 Tax=Chaetomium tenue TaxID=1854479 RepID=A0ACB7PME5_9PEZI|nr:hypothetical protein F5144DRAFT_43973 [Chaetomium globosum]
MNSRTQRSAPVAKAGGGGAAAANSSQPVQRQTNTTTTTSTTTAAKPKPPSEATLLKWRQADARLFASTLRGTPYALIGGFALQLLGSKRLCSGYHIFVPTGHSARVIEQMAASSSGFFKKVGRSTRSITLDRDGIQSMVHIHEPPELRQAFPDTDDGFVIVFSSARVLKPALLLNIAIHDWMEEHAAGNNNWKKKKANADIIFLADYIARKEREDMTHATPAFLNAFFAANAAQEPVFFSIGIKKPVAKTGGDATGANKDGSVAAR